MQPSHGPRGAALLLALLVLGACARPAAAQASPPQLLTIQGRLTNAAGVPENGNRDITVRFYDALAAGTLLLTDAHTGAGAVPVTNGLYELTLGGGTITAGSKASVSLVFKDVATVYISLQVAADPEMSPRSRIVSSGYAQNARYFDGYATTDFVRLTPSAAGRLIYDTGAAWTTLAAGSSGQALVSAGAAAPTWGPVGIAAGGTGTTTAFTQGSVVFAGAGGVYTQNNASFFWDNTNFRLGVGKTTPYESIDVAGRINANSDGSNEDPVGFGAFAASSGPVGGSWGTMGTFSAICWSNGYYCFHGWAGPGTSAGGLIIQQDGTGDAIQVTDSGPQTFVVKKGGNVGIGPGVPARLLDVSGHLRATGGLATPPALDTNYPTGHMTIRSQGHLFLEASSGSNTHLCGNLYWDGTNWNRFNTLLGGAFWWTGNDGTGAFYTAPAGANPASPTQKFVIDNTGIATFNNQVYVNYNANQFVYLGQNTTRTSYFYMNEPDAAIDDRTALYAYRTRSIQNDGTNYAIGQTNSALTAYNFWGDVYTFGGALFSFNDYTRTGGVLGAIYSGAYWGSLGYKNSASTGYGAYWTSSGTGVGYVPKDKRGLGDPSDDGGEDVCRADGIGFGSYGTLFGGWTRGEVYGSYTAGERFSSYDSGNSFGSGYQATLHTPERRDDGRRQRVPLFGVSSLDVDLFAHGVGHLRGGRAAIEFEESFRDAVSQDVPLALTVTPMGLCKQLCVVSISREGASVQEADGASDVDFSWIAIGRRGGYEKRPEVPEELLDPDFDARMRGVTFNENDREHRATYVWYDDRGLHFGGDDFDPSSLSARGGTRGIQAGGTLHGLSNGPVRTAGAMGGR